MKKALILFLGLMMAGGVAMAQDLIQDVWPPYSIGQEGQPPTGGSIVEIVTEVYKRLGVPATMKLYPWPRCLNMIKEGQADAIMGASVNEERKSYIVFSDPVQVSVGKVYSTSERKFEWSDWSQMMGLRIGTTAGFNYGDDFKAAAAQHALKVDSARSDDLNFNKLAAGRLDVFFCTEETHDKFVEDNPQFKGKFHAASKPYFVYEYRMAFSQKNSAKDLIPQINKTLAEMKADGTTDAIIKKYR